MVSLTVPVKCSRCRSPFSGALGWFTLTAMRRIVLALVLPMALMSCGDSHDDVSKTDVTAQQMADQLADAIPFVSQQIPLTEDNDTNNLIGRPGQYDQAVFLADDRLTGQNDCNPPDFGELDTACGAKIERWPTEADAQARLEDIQRKLKNFGLGAEYDYVIGRILVRVSADLKPTEAAQYEAATRVTSPSAVADGIDEDGWRAAAEARIGHPFRNDAAWESYRDGTIESCQEKGDDPDAWGLYLSIGIDHGLPAAGVEEDVSYACPENLDAVRTEIQTLQDLDRKLREACDMASVYRTQEQQDLVDAVGC